MPAIPGRKEAKRAAGGGAEGSGSLLSVGSRGRHGRAGLGGSGPRTGGKGFLITLPEMFRS